MPRIQETKSCDLSVAPLGSAYVMSPQAKMFDLLVAWFYIYYVFLTQWRKSLSRRAQEGSSIVFHSKCFCKFFAGIALCLSSSVGKASDWWSQGQRFNSAQFHQTFFWQISLFSLSRVINIFSNSESITIGVIKKLWALKVEKRENNKKRWRERESNLWQSEQAHQLICNFKSLFQAVQIN